MLTGSIRNQIDAIWNAFWSGGVSNPLSVIEQITYLLFIKRLDELHTLEENKAQALGKPMSRRIFPAGEDPKGRAYEDLRWSRFRNFEAREMMEVVDEHVFPFLRTLGEEGSSYGRHMKDARLGFSNANLLAKVVAQLAGIEMADRDTTGDVYEYMLGKIASAGQNGQFRTPRHIIRLMVALTAPTPEDVICDPAAGTCGFLVAAGEYLRENHPGLFRNDRQRSHFHHGMFNGFDFDATMLRIGAMNMTLHGVDDPEIAYRDSLAEDHAEDAGAYRYPRTQPQRRVRTEGPSPAARGVEADRGDPGSGGRAAPPAPPRPRPPEHPRAGDLSGDVWGPVFEPRCKALRQAKGRHYKDNLRFHLPDVTP